MEWSWRNDVPDPVVIDCSVQGTNHSGYSNDIRPGGRKELLMLWILFLGVTILNGLRQSKARRDAFDDR